MDVLQKLQLYEMSKKKFYIVWAGHKPGVYITWQDAQVQIKGFQGARYKSFKCTDIEAEEIFIDGPANHIENLEALEYWESKNFKSTNE